MNCKELRIGNFILWRDKIQRVRYVFDDTIVCDELDAERSITEFEPVKLDRKNIRNLGLKLYRGNRWYLPGPRELFIRYETYKNIWPEKEKGYLLIGAWEGFNSIPIKYVHQLQNLYFALTGQELELRPETPDGAE